MRRSGERERQLSSLQACFEAKLTVPQCNRVSRCVGKHPGGGSAAFPPRWDVLSSGPRSPLGSLPRLALLDVGAKFVHLRCRIYITLEKKKVVADV